MTNRKRRGKSVYKEDAVAVVHKSILLATVNHLFDESAIGRSECICMNDGVKVVKQIHAMSRMCYRFVR